MILLENNESTIDIFTEEGNRLYQIPKAELEDILVLHGHSVSDWVHQLLRKTWIEYHILYEVAKIIQDTFPSNSIDWHYTFFIVEKHYYLKHAQSMDSRNDNNQKSIYRKLLSAIEVGKEEQTEELNSKIHEIVDQQIKQYQIN